MKSNIPVANSWLSVAGWSTVPTNISGLALHLNCLRSFQLPGNFVEGSGENYKLLYNMVSFFFYWNIINWHIPIKLESWNLAHIYYRALHAGEVVINIWTFVFHWSSPEGQEPFFKTWTVQIAFWNTLEKWHSDSACITDSNINSKLEPELFH